MKVSFLPLAFLIVLLAAGQAVDIVTPTETYKDAKVTKVEENGVRIAHSEGAALVDFDDLPPAMQAQYGWTPEKSAARKAAREAEAKKIADEERMKEEEPKRKAEEAAAKERAMQDEKTAANGVEALARAKEDAMAAQKDLIAEAAAARAQIDRDRRGIKSPPTIVVEAPSVPVAAVVAKPEAKPEAKPKTAPVGAVAALIEGDKTTVWNPKIAIGLGIAAAIVLVLFLLPSSKSKVRVVTGAQGRRR